MVGGGCVGGSRVGEVGVCVGNLSSARFERGHVSKVVRVGSGQERAGAAARS